MDVRLQRILEGALMNAMESICRFPVGTVAAEVVLGSARFTWGRVQGAGESSAVRRI